MKDNAFNIEVATRVKRARLEAGKTQTDVYDHTGINVARIEQGTHSIQVITIAKLSDYLGVQPEKLVPVNFFSQGKKLTSK